jgi:flagellar hook-length control protein FliK
MTKQIPIKISGDIFSNNKLYKKQVPRAEKNDLSGKSSFEDELSIASGEKAEDLEIDKPLENFGQSGAKNEIIQQVLSSFIQSGELSGLDKHSYKIENNLAQRSEQAAQKPAKEDIEDQSSLKRAMQNSKKQLLEKMPKNLNQLSFANMKELKEALNIKLTSEYAIPQIEANKIFDDLVKRIQLLKEGEVNYVKMDLRPKGLGRLEVLLSMQDGKITIHFASNEDAKKYLDTHINELKEVLVNEGYDVANLEVDIFDFDQKQEFNDQQGSSENSDNDAKNQEYDMLKILHQADIIESIDKWLGDVIIRYLV